MLNGVQCEFWRNVSDTMKWDSQEDLLALAFLISIEETGTSRKFNNFRRLIKVVFNLLYNVYSLFDDKFTCYVTNNNKLESKGFYLFQLM